LADIHGSIRSHLSEIKWISDLIIDQLQTNAITMKAIILMIICILVTIQGYAQTAPKKIKLYNARIRTMEDKKLIKGTFFELNDSSIILIDAKSKEEVFNNQFQSRAIPVCTIKWMKIRRKGKVVSSALLGAVVGGTTGAIIGFAQGDDEPPCGWWGDGGCLSAKDKAGLAGVPLFLVGGAIGAGAGSKRKHFEINGMPERIIEYHEILNQYSISKNLTSTK